MRLNRSTVGELSGLVEFETIGCIRDHLGLTFGHGIGSGLGVYGSGHRCRG